MDLNQQKMRDIDAVTGKSALRCWGPLCAAMIIFAWFTFTQAAWGAPRFSTSFDRTTIQLGETTMLSLEFEEATPQGPPTLPAIPGLQIQYRGQSQHYQVVNGQTSSTMVFNYAVLPQKTGDFTIPGFSIQIGGRTLSSQPAVLKVVAAGTEAGAAGQPGTNELAFVRIALPKTNLFLGEAILAELQVYLQQGEPLQYPQLTADGFTVGKFGEPRPSRTQLNNRVYNVFVIPVVLTPLKTGVLRVGPIECNSKIIVQRGRRVFGSPFDLLDRFAESQQISAHGEPVAVNVLPLPTQNVPPGFSGAVGKFALSLAVSPTNVSVGEPITLRVQVAGRGALDTASLPMSSGWDRFKLYPPSSKLEVTDSLGLESIKTFEQVVTPQTLDVKEVPIVSFAYFDPDERQYKTLQQGPVPIAVSPASTVNLAALAPGATPAGSPRSPELAHIKTRLGLLQPIQLPLVQRPGFWGLQMIPLVLWLSSVIYRRSQNRLSADPRLRRQRHAERAVRIGLKQLHRLAANQQTDEFFAVLFRVIQEQMGATLNLPASAITETDLENRLRPAGFDPAVLEQLHQLLQKCDQARYSRQHTASDLAGTLPQLEQCLRALRTFVPGDDMNHRP
jgi:hypothetical protein